MSPESDVLAPVGGLAPPVTLAKEAAAPPADPVPGAATARSLWMMACLGGGLLLFEVLLTRLLAIVLFSNVAFGAIAMALLGMGLGGWLAALHEKRPDEVRLRRVRTVLIAAAALAAIAFAVATLVPLIPETISRGEKVVWTYSTRKAQFDKDPMLLNWPGLALVVVLQMVPFAAAAYAQALMLGRAPAAAGRLYAADVAGATLGALSSLVFLRWFGAVNAVGVVMLLFAAAAHLTPGTPSRRMRISGTVVAAAAVGVLAFGPLKVRYAAGFSEHQVVDAEWSSLARVALYEAARDPEPGELKDPWLLIDNTSRTMVSHKGDRRFTENLERIPFAMRPEGSVLIIGAGGGQEIESAVQTAAPGVVRRIDAVEVAGGVPRLLEKHFGHRDDYVLDQPGVDYHVADGRSFVDMSRDRWTIIQMLEVNFHSLAGQASLAWSPSLLFTREAFRGYLDHLTDDGFLSIVRYHPDSGRASTQHLLSTIRAATDELGLDLGERLVVVDRKYGHGIRRMVLLSKRPWDEASLADLRSRLEASRSPRNPDEGPDLIRAPGVPFPIEDTEQIISGDAGRVIAKVLKKRHLFLDPVVDDRPFGHQHAKFFAATFRGIGDDQSDIRLQSLNFQFLFGVIVLFVVLSALLIAAFLWRTKRGSRGHAGAQLVLFAMLGFGFMVHEVGLMERAGLLLGHPTVALVAILTALLVALTVGSAASEWLMPERRRGVRYGVVALALLGVVLLPPLLPEMGPWLRESVPEGARPWVVGGLTLALGAPLGIFLPSAIRASEHTGGATAPALWATNGATSVMGTVAAALLVRSVGFDVTSWVATAAYVLAGLLWLRVLRAAGAR
ncbi:hypothetical protein L6R50_06555 [Myxococcota bacterium]|nr:hypothetical protein [Myxococcota bacterium]